MVAEAKLAAETVTKDTGEVKLINFDFSGDLDSEDIDGIPTMTIEVGGDGLTIGTVTGSVKKAQALFSSGTAGTIYTILCTVVSNGSPAQTFIGRGKINVPAI